MTYQISDEWQPNASSRLFAAGVAAGGSVNVEAQLAKFRAYEFKDPVRDADKVWVSWLKRSTGYSSQKSDSVERSPPTDKSPTALLLDRIDNFRRTEPEQYRRLEAYMAGHRWWNDAGRGFQIEQMQQAITERAAIFEFLDSEGREY